MTNKIVLVSGANKGIGKEAAKQLGKLGYKVYLGARNLDSGKEAAAELKGAGIDAEAIQLDVTDEKSVKAALSALGKQCGRLDVLVNNAGILNERVSDIAATSVPAVEETMQTNFIGPLRLLQESLPWLEKSDAPRVVNVSSSLGSITKASDPASGFDGFLYVGYSCSKAALNMLTAVSASCFKNKKIKINSICPGYVATDINNNEGYRSVEQGAAIIVKMATLDDNGPTGGYFNDDGTIPW